MDLPITVGIPTKNRVDSLCQTLLSIVLQHSTPTEIIIVDDSEKPIDLRTLPVYEHLFRMMDDKKIKWKVLFGQKKGQHFSHQLIQEIAENDLIFRIDDDCVAELDVLDFLYQYMHSNSKLGAIGPCVLMHNPQFLPDHLTTNSIEKIYEPNIQWFRNTGLKQVDHLYSCFLYRKGIATYDLSLSTVAHREETIFSHSIKRAGYELWVDSSVVWHNRQESGGIRSFHNRKLWEEDEKIFNRYLNDWGVSNIKTIVLDCGLGDHYCFKNLLPALREKYDSLQIACCYPDVFHDEPGLTLISIQDAKQLFGNIESFNVYRYMDEKNWKAPLLDAFKSMYLWS